MVSVTYSAFHSVMNLTIGDIPAVNTENLLDWAIDTINLYGNTAISNMTGVAGSKTVTLTSRQRGAVFILAKFLYPSYRGPKDKISVDGVSIQSVDPLFMPGFDIVMKRISRLLQTRSIVLT